MASDSSPISRLTGKPITPERVRELVEYDPATGTFHRRVGRFAGEIAGSTGRGGRSQLRLEGRLVSAHRIAWAYVTGRWPEDEIDHRDGNGGNNAFDNLREATRPQNCQNTRIDRANSSSGHKGVSYRKDSGKWRARIGFRGKKITLGVFNTKDEAIAAYLKAAAEHHGDFARLE